MQSMYCVCICDKHSLVSPTLMCSHLCLSANSVLTSIELLLAVSQAANQASSSLSSSRAWPMALSLVRLLVVWSSRLYQPQGLSPTRPATCHAMALQVHKRQQCFPAFPTARSERGMDSCLCEQRCCDMICIPSCLGVSLRWFYPLFLIIMCVWL